MRRTITCILSVFVTWLAVAPCRAQDEASRRLAQRLAWFQDQKFGLFIHWGPYSQMGCKESWPLSWADRKRANPAITTKEEMLAFRAKYWGLSRTFNPVAFDPDRWAALAQRAGMRYVVFTTKHHDGFSMFDTQLSDYKITAPAVPFSRNKRANITAEVFRAFRARGFGIGAYFSKPDWHSPYYWSPDSFPEDRNPNYDVAANPDRWAKFIDFVHGQVRELITEYGPIDILWLDGGQVKPPKQDIRMDQLVAMARKHQPDLIVVNRSSGQHEDYRTPERQVPEHPLDYVWESCLTMGTQWSYKPDDEYKSTRTLIHLLVDIVAKGGNLLLNIGPRSDGTLPPEAVMRLEEIGNWMAVNGEAIHGTRPATPYKDGNVALTQKGKTTYAIYLAPEGADPIPAQIRLSTFQCDPGAAIALLGTKEKVKFQSGNGGTVITLSESARKQFQRAYALVFKFQPR